MLMRRRIGCAVLAGMLSLVAVMSTGCDGVADKTAAARMLNDDSITTGLWIWPTLPPLYDGGQQGEE